ncbi:MAG TPA: serine hydrolase domain-containing protein [Roseiflexaceae bacterium]
MLLSHEINAIVADAIARRVFPGAVVLIAGGNELRHYAAYGSTMYDAPGSRPVRRDTIYDVASLTKMFTATATLRLSDAGALNLHAPVAAYLPSFRVPDIGVWHLLTHTSGLDIRLSSLRHVGRERLLEAVYRLAPAREPGATVAYTNVNSLLLGEIVAKLYGAPLDEALDGLVIRPLGLRDTLFRPPASLLTRIAPTEIDEDWRGRLVHGTVHDESAHALGGVTGHAGLFSTAADLYTFCRAWLDLLEPGDEATKQRGDNTSPSPSRPVVQSPSRPADSLQPPLLKKATAALAITDHTLHLNTACGLGWMLDRPNFMSAAPRGSFGHTGFTGPAIVVIPARRLIVVVLSNRVYPRRRPPEHHAVTAAIVQAALSANDAPLCRS